MSYCYDSGIPHSEFLERWSAEDRAKVAAVAMERSQRCVSCGSAPHEWEADPDAYVAVRVRCPGCMRREIMAADDDTQSKGVSIRLLPRAVAERLAAETEAKAAAGTLRPKRRRE